MNSPKVSFIYAYPLDRGRRKLFAEKGLNYPTQEEVKSIITHWEQLWAKTTDEHNIIQYLMTITGRVPERNLECFVFGAGLQAMSTPFLLPVWNKEGKQWSDKKFVDLVIHELLHIFLSTDNDYYWRHTEKEFSQEEPVTRNHILLYAMMYQIYQEVFNCEPLDFSRENLPLPYARAVHLVRELGYKELISEYRSCVGIGDTLS